MSNKQQPTESTDIRTATANRRSSLLSKSATEREEESRAWQIENADAIRSMNAYFEEHGFPFPQFRRY